MRYLSIFALLVGLCGCVKASYERRISITSEFDEATCQKLATEVVKCLQSRPFALALRERFPGVTDAKMMSTEVRLGWFEAIESGRRTRQWWVSFGIKDVSALPNAREIIDYSCDYAVREHSRLVENLRAERK